MAKHEPTPKTRAEVTALASFGVPQEDIAAFIGISHVTLRKYYGDELALSAIKANNEVAGFLFTVASGRARKSGASYADCTRAAMFWAKTRMGWRETNNLDHTSSDGTMSPRKLTGDELIKELEARGLPTSILEE